MRSGYAVAAASLTILLAPTSEAQYAAPIGVQRLEVASVAPAQHRDTVDQGRPANTGGAIAGGVLGAVSGTAIGIGFGMMSAQGCHEEFCGLAAALLGFVIAEPLGVAIGTHVGSGGHGNVALTTLSSIGILVGGAMAGHSTGNITLLAVPAVQIATAVALSRD